MNNTETNTLEDSRSSTELLKKKRLPAERCVICNKTIDEIGGKRIVGQQDRKVFLCDRYIGGGNPAIPYQSFILYENGDLYVVVRGEIGFWNEDSIQRAIATFRKGFQPWFCCICGHRTCSQCGSPINAPVGSDWIADNGCTCHSPILGYNPGCINPKCSQYKKWPF